MTYNEKIARLYNHYYTNNSLSLIIGSGNTRTDYTRHRHKYNIAIGGECDDSKEDLIAFAMYTGTEEFVDFIFNIGSMINLVAVDYSVCCEFSYDDLLFLMNCLSKEVVLYVPLRNIRVDDIYLDTIVSNSFSKNKLFSEKYRNIQNKFLEKLLSKFVVILYENNNDYSYPISKYENNMDIIKNISYLRIRNNIEEPNNNNL